jgi:hypothetical protein
MTASRIIRTAIASATVAVVALVASACCKSGTDSQWCPSSYKELSADQQAGRAACECRPGTPAGSVWGTDTYTTDSSLCGAAVHAGVITTAGGPITVRGAAGCPAYVGSERNGVSAGAWGAYEASFFFPGKGTGTCPAAPSSNTCPNAFKDIPGLSASTTITCTCDSTRMNGSVWGTDIYTQDSSICRAAVHAGVITTGGGSVTAKAAAGCKSYKGGVRGGVESSDWGEYDTSFYFPSKGTGTCP